jgi:WD40 repeat protein
VSDNDKFKIINTMGHIFSFCSAGGSEFALGRNQSIQILDAKQNAIKNILKGYDEIYTCVLFHNNQILSGSNTASIKIWSLKTFKCIQSIQNVHDIEYTNLIVSNNIILASNPEVKRIRLWQSDDFTKPLE